jgi:Flp pilus assembly protein TadD
MEVTHGNSELAYAYAQFLHRRGDEQRAHEVIRQALASPTLQDNPVGEGEIRLEEAKDRARLGDLAGARIAISRAAALIPRDDEAWPEADSLRKALAR